MRFRHDFSVKEVVIDLFRTESTPASASRDFEHSDRAFAAIRQRSGPSNPVPQANTSRRHRSSRSLGGHASARPPAGTKSFALIVEDPDAPSGTFHHWGLYNIMGERTLLPEGVGHGAKTKTERFGKASMISASRATMDPLRRRDTEPIITISSWRRWMSKRFRERPRCRLPISGSRLKSIGSRRQNSSASIVGDAYERPAPGSIDRTPNCKVIMPRYRYLGSSMHLSGSMRRMR